MAEARGRPIGFEDGEALDAAVMFFWTHGYEGASVDALCREMNMPRATLYARFGDKEGLFRAAVARYAETRVAPVLSALWAGGGLRADLEAFYAAVLALCTANEAAPGCLISCALADAAGANPAFREELAERFAAMEERITARLVAAGWDARAATPPEVAAGLAATLARGLTLAARAGTAEAELRKTAAAATPAILRLAPEHVVAVCEA
ncbi:TetR/AcrR family transcriptional regulator [Rhodosalinus sediminis]|uniref:TetR/AcrR family transcriptional regulator n=1 Tax=Rhodosalinus sediminis TaxID=1940533 RepID=A0A3D9BSM9_9RHOB|nr:TetR/AcrR family transcriptional regulator [Rhodosalinus sediminis]REC56361.1 TetR/AcrR family transcriptional regulator [Rhodosalinus sediminis]